MLKANDNMIKENAAKPIIHTVFSGVGRLGVALPKPPLRVGGAHYRTVRVRAAAREYLEADGEQRP